MAVLIVLGLLVGHMSRETRISLDFETVSAEELGDQLEFDSPLGVEDVETAEEMAFSLSELPEVRDPLAAPQMLELQPDGALTPSEIDVPQIGLALTGREAGRRASLLGRYGGDGRTENAVDKGLDWLAQNQAKTGPDAGSWSLSGPFRDGVSRNYDNPVAATAMALLAFQGRGNTHKKGPYRENVAAGWRWLLEQQDGDGSFFHEGPMNHRFYTQGQCTIALCELYGMTGDSRFLGPAEQAVKYCLRSQSGEGGWKYVPAGRSDLSVTGWILMGLQSARMAKIEVPEDCLQRVERFLDRVAAEDDASRYCYEPGKMPSRSMTAEGLLCRQYLGWARDDPRLVEGVEWITQPENLVNFDDGRDVYYWYYATQVAHHMEGEYWQRWNRAMKQVLPQQQVQRGREMGSWDPVNPTRDQWASYGGRLYVTCLSIYMLEVYYRHLPLYTKVYGGK